MSVPPPGGNATTMRTGFAGNVCASALAPAAAASSATIPTAILFMSDAQESRGLLETSSFPMPARSASFCNGSISAAL